MSLEQTNISVSLLGNEAAALGAHHAGISGAYGYPGTPSTEAMEYLHEVTPHQTHWCTNEKTALEAALGMSLVGRRALVVMKHVGLNVAADPFMSSALVGLHAGVVLLIADDPGMHSSQNEQDSRFYAEMAKIPCFEPANNQEAYDMTRSAFEFSEAHGVPVMVRLVTRVAHTRELVKTQVAESEKPLQKSKNPESWVLMPTIARKRWHLLLERQADLEKFAHQTKWNWVSDKASEVKVITTGSAINSYLENCDDLETAPSHLHLGFYPWPERMLRDFLKDACTVYVFEEGQPFLEKSLRGILPQDNIRWIGRLSGEVPREGELTPDSVRRALGLNENESLSPLPDLAARPPQLCPGCPHTDSYRSLNKVFNDFLDAPHLVTGDVGCYTLGALGSLKAIETCLCMGASIGLAKGASDAGFSPAVAVIGDGTFLHTGIPPLLDAIATNANITILILDNQVTGMTGGQPQLLPSSRLKEIVIGCGVDPQHVRSLQAHRKFEEQNAQIMKEEIAHPGVSVLIAVRECIETAKRKKRTEAQENL